MGPVPQFNPNGQSLVRTWVCNPTQQVKLQAVDPVHEPHVFHSPSTEVNSDDSCINPFKLNGIYHSNFCSYWTMPFLFKGLFKRFFFKFYSNLDKTFCEQNVENLIRRRVLRCPMWLCPTNRPAGLYELK